MKQLFTYVLVLCFSLRGLGQYYLRGEVKNEKGQTLSGVKIYVHALRYNYSTGAYGSFGIATKVLKDSLTVSLEGYETKTINVVADAWQKITLSPIVAIANNAQLQLLSLTQNMSLEKNLSFNVNDETYFQLVENPFVSTSNFPNTLFSLSVNKASYSNVRRFINMGMKVPPDAVKVEEMINYFNLGYEEPPADQPFSVSTKISDCPWAKGEQLLYIKVDAKKFVLDSIPPGNFVFLIDVSGSMDMPNRLPLLKSAFQMFVKNLRPVDVVSMVIYGGTVGVYLQPTPGSEKEKILAAIESLTANGDTPGESAIRAAYKLAESTFITGGNNRIILATDGDFNVGERSEKALDELITKERETGVYLTCLGVGMGNLKDSKLQTLAKKGNGNYAYLDDVREAEKVLVKELTQTLYAVADDVFMNVRFNEKKVKKYRLIGFDNRKDAISSAAGRLEGGEIGSGNSTLAIFQIVPADAEEHRTLEDNKAPLATLKFQFKTCGNVQSTTQTYDVPEWIEPQSALPQYLRFATAVTMFALQLKNSAFAGALSWAMVQQYGEDAAQQDNFLQKEFLNLIKKAQEIYEGKKKKRKGLFGG